MDGYRTLRVHEERDALRIVLDRPQRQNSINDAMLADLDAALDRAEAIPECRLVVIEGSGGVFCAGMDLTAVPDSGEGAELFLALLKRLTTLSRAVVSAVDGRVSGGGVGIAAASDFVYATPRSTFGLPEALWGLLPCCVLPFLVRRVGYQPAHAMTLSTLPVPADRAHSLHLVDELTDDVEAPLRRLRIRLAKVDVATLGAAKAYLRGMWSLTEETERAAVAEFSRLVATPVVRQRISAFTTAQALPWEHPSTGRAS